MNKNLIKGFSSLLFLSSIFFSCSFQNNDKRLTYKKIVVSFNIPIVKLTGELMNISDSFSIIYHDNYTLYLFPYTKSLENSVEIQKIERPYKYFFYKNGETNGYIFDSSNATTFKTISVDSFLRKKAFWGNKFYDVKNDSLVQETQNGNSLIEKYISKSKPDESYADTTIFYYTMPAKAIEYSFSKELEMQKKMQIIKVRILYNSQYYKGYAFKFPNREFWFKLNEVNIENEKNIEELFSVFKSSIKS